MTSVQQLFKSLERSFSVNKNEKRSHKVSSISPSCYETVLNLKSKCYRNTPSFTHNVSSKASDYAFLSSKYGFTERAQRLYDCIDKITNDDNTKQHHLHLLAILLQISESPQSLFNPINTNNNNYNFFELSDNSSIDFIPSHRNETVDNLDILFKAIPSTQHNTERHNITVSMQNMNMLMQNDDEKNQDVMDDDDNIWISDESELNFMNPFSSKISYSNGNNTNSWSTSFEDTMNDDDDGNIMGVAVYDDDHTFVGDSLSCFRSSDYTKTINSVTHSIHDIDTINSFRNEWNHIKNKWIELQTDDDDIKSEIYDPERDVIPSNQYISCSYFKGSEIKQITNDTKDSDYLLSDKQINAYNERYMLSIFGCNVSHKALFVSTSNVISSILNGLLGVADNNNVIFYNEKCNEFFPTKCFCAGFSIESMNDILHNVCDVATKYIRIEQFANKYKNSFIEESLCFGVNEYLNFYAECILSLPSSIINNNDNNYNNLNVMDIMCHISKLSESMSFLYNLCSSLSRMNGVDILQFLYETILKSIDNDHSLSIYLFQSCFEPLINIISSWIYCGEIKDFHHEITEKNDDDTKYIMFNKLPLFLDSLRSDIERSGYSLNILKKCDFNLFCCCFVPNFFDETDYENINYPLRAVFNDDDIKLYSKRQKKLIKLQISFFEDIKRKFYQKEKEKKEFIQQENMKQIEILKRKKEIQEKEMETQRKEIIEKQKQMRSALQKTIHQKRINKKRIKRERINTERKQLFQMKIDEEKEIHLESIKIKQEIKKVETQRKHNALLMEWKMERAKLNPKRAELIHNLDNKYFKEFQQLKQTQKITKNNQSNTTKTETTNQINHQTLTEESLLQFDSLQIKENVSMNIEEEEEDDDDAKLPQLPIEEDTEKSIENKETETKSEKEIEIEIETENNEDVMEMDEKVSLNIKYKAKPYTIDFDFSNLDENKMKTTNSGWSFIFDCDHQFIPIQECIKQSIFGGIQFQSFIVDKVTLFLFMDKLRLLDHFESLNRFYLMNNGDLMNRFCNNLYLKQCSVNNRLRPCFINLIFFEIAKNMNYDEFVKRLKFVESRFDEYDKALLMEMVGDYANYSDSSSFLSEIYLNYDIEWPLTEIITPKMINNYNFILIFFLYLHHVESQLIECWKEMKIRKNMNDSLLIKYGISWHKLQIFRRECHLIIDNLMGFFNNQILNISWNRFKNNLMEIDENNSNIFFIKELHEKYIDHLLESCFLNQHQSDLRKRIHKMLELMIEFKNNTSKLLVLLDLNNNEIITDNNFNYINNRNIDNVIRNIVHSMDSFQSVSKFVFKILDKLNKTRVSHIIHHLSLQLDFNYYYNNTDSNKH